MSKFPALLRLDPFIKPLLLEDMVFSPPYYCRSKMISKEYEKPMSSLMDFVYRSNRNRLY